MNVNIKPSASGITASDAGKRNIETSPQPRAQNHETSDHYKRVLVQLCPRHRVVVCKDNIQWVMQQRKKGGGEWPWRARGYFRTRKALIRLTASLCSRIDPGTIATLAAFPEIFGGTK